MDVFDVPPDPAIEQARLLRAEAQALRERFRLFLARRLDPGRKGWLEGTVGIGKDGSSLLTDRPGTGATSRRTAGELETG